MQFFEQSRHIRGSLYSGATAPHRIRHIGCHCLPDAEAGSQTRPQTGSTALVCRCDRNTLCRVVLREAAHVAEHVHADALIEKLLNFLWQRNVLYLKRLKLEAVSCENTVELCFHSGAELILIGRHIEEWNRGLRDKVGNRRYDRVPELF